MEIDREQLMKQVKDFHEALVKVGNTYSLEDFILVLAGERVAELITVELRRRKVF